MKQKAKEKRVSQKITNIQPQTGNLNRHQKNMNDQV